VTGEFCFTMARARKASSKPDSSVLILWDQISPKISCLKGVPKNTPILIVEPGKELRSRLHQKKKLVLILSALRHLRQELEDSGYTNIDYYALDDKSPARRRLADAGLAKCVAAHVRKVKPQRLRVMHPSEHDSWKTVSGLGKKLGITVEVTDNNLFLGRAEDFSEWETIQRELVMENFYRMMRRKLNVLMEGDYPVGGRWNYDVENRVPPMENMEFADLPWVPPDEITQKAIAVVNKKFKNHVGSTDGFKYPVTCKQFGVWFDDFITQRLKLFGMYQDAMVRENPLMYHSLISPGMNIGLLHPLECVRKVEDSYYHGDTPINSAEGFIRQIIGWREYVHGIYWTRMPEYRDLNFFNHEMKIPTMLNDGRTRMSCVKEVVEQTLELGYAHHIQRLMILGNFALLVGVSPQEMVNWFMSMYIDAYEWVVLPNVLGMILFADGGYLGTKPYAASANYIGKMSNYCKNCFYKSRKRVGERACPYNFLYWYFLQQNEQLLGSNKRMTMVYNLLHRKSESEMGLVVRSSEDFLRRMEESGTDRRLRR
jgi:deoxyribodipyrimidine photolyase-related protein